MPFSDRGMAQRQFALSDGFDQPRSSYLIRPSRPNQNNQILFADDCFRFRCQKSNPYHHTHLLLETDRDTRRGGVGVGSARQKRRTVKRGVGPDEALDRSYVRAGSDQWRISQAPSFGCVSFQSPVAEDVIFHGADSARSVPAHESAARTVGDTTRSVFPTGVA